MYTNALIFGVRSCMCEPQAMVGNLQVLALAVPVLVMVADDPISGFFLRAGVIFLQVSPAPS